MHPPGHDPNNLKQRQAEYLPLIETPTPAPTIQSSTSQPEPPPEQPPTIKLLQCFHIQMVAVPFPRNNPSAAMPLQRPILPAKTFREKTRSASGSLIAGNPLAKIPGLPFPHFRLKRCSLIQKRSRPATLGETSRKRSTHRPKLEHGQLGKCLRNSPTRQRHM